MSNAVTVPVANLPAHLQSVVGTDAGKEFTSGVHSGFPIISYRGKTWRVRQGGEEQVYVDDEGGAIQTVELVLVRSNERLSKTYYKGKYVEGDKAKPECWSANGIAPDSDVVNPINVACQTCPMNVWGSRTTDEGKKTRACQDVRRVAVSFAHELEAFERGEKPLDEIPVMLLRIPPATLNVLKSYVEKVLDPKGLPPFVLTTKIGFDTDASYPKMTFKGGRFLTEAEFSAVTDLRESDIVKRILDTSAELADAGTTGEGGEAASSASTAKAETPEPAPAEVSSNTEEQHFSEAVDDIAPAPVAQRPAAVEEAATAVVIEQPPQATVVTPKPAATSEVEATPAESPSGDADIDDMLSSILD